MNKKENKNLEKGSNHFKDGNLKNFSYLLKLNKLALSKLL